jgi:integrase
LEPQELLALKWDDFDGEFLTIQRCVSDHKIKETTKTGRSRRVYVPKWVSNELRNAPSRFGKTWIFPNTKNGFNVKSEIFNEEWRKVHQELEIPYGEEQNRTPYTCRHTRAAELLSQGVPPAKGAEQLGHSVLVFLNTYSEWIDEYSKTDNSLLESQNKSSFVRNLSETAKNDV